MMGWQRSNTCGPLGRDGPLYGCMTARTTGICLIKLNLITEEYHV